ncbi:calcyclin-binding protein [Dermacentor albipictus]|uniref:calcyclin-binding protein n=1 Tax=Dermacentor albipictus TaxID=60249 RepID=UPI0031FC6829
MPKLEELEQDLVELRALEASAQRSRVQQILSIEIRKLETELIRERDQVAAATAPHAEARHATSQQSRNTTFTTKITDYAWDQSDKFVKLYITLPGVHELPPENIKSVFGTRRLELEVSSLAGRNHQLLITSLMKDIVPDSSYHKVKTDMVAVFLRKTSADKWSDINELEKKAKEAKVPKPDVVDGSDPGSSLMNMMKQLYDEGDDEMKRTIAKAWTEAREKQQETGEGL